MGDIPSEVAVGRDATEPSNMEARLDLLLNELNSSLTGISQARDRLEQFV